MLELVKFSNLLVIAKVTKIMPLTVIGLVFELNR